MRAWACQTWRGMWRWCTADSTSAVPGLPVPPQPSRVTVPKCPSAPCRLPFVPFESTCGASAVCITAAVAALMPRMWSAKYCGVDALCRSLAVVTFRPCTSEALKETVLEKGGAGGEEL